LDSDGLVAPKLSLDDAIAGVCSRMHMCKRTCRFKNVRNI